MNSWEKKKLGEVITLQRGFDITKKERLEGSYDVISSSGVSYTHNEYKVKGPGVIIGRKGSLGTVHYTDSNFWPHDTTLWVKKFNGNDPLFIYYFLKTLHLEKYDVGASNPTLNRNHVHKLQVSVPELSTQQEIVSILSAFDQLIENNTRRIEILEEMARLIYREWFVHYRYPGHENDKLVDSGTDLGEIPEGWEVLKLSDLMDYNGGSQPPKKEWFDEPGKNRVRMIQIRDYESDNYISYVDTNNNLRYCNRKDIMIARYGASVGRICWGLEGCYNVALVKVVPEKCHFREFLRQFLESNYFQESLIGMSGRTAQAGFNKGVLDAINVTVPKNHDLFNRFETTVNPLLDQILSLRNKNVTLKETRDLLLPKLISGKINLKY